MKSSGNKPAPLTESEIDAMKFLVEESREAIQSGAFELDEAGYLMHGGCVRCPCGCKFRRLVGKNSSYCLECGKSAEVQ